MTHPSKKDTGSGPQQPAGKRRRRWLKALLILVVLLGIFLGLLPNLLSTSMLRNLILGQINQAIAGTLSYQELSLSWFGKQTIEGLSVKDPQGQPVLLARRTTLGAGLWSLLTGHFNLGQNTLEGLEVRALTDATGSNNLVAALQPKQPRKPQEEGRPPLKLPASLAFTLDIKQAKVTLSAPGQEPVLVEKLQLQLSLPSIRKALAFKIQAAVHQGRLSGTIHGAGNLKNLLNEKGTLQVEAARIQAELTLDRLPVDGIDRLAGLKGMLRSALGGEMNLEASLAGSLKHQDVRLKARCPHLQLDLSGRIKNRVLVASAQPSLHFTLTKSLMQQLGEEIPSLARFHLQQDLPLVLTLQKLRLPLDGFRPAEMGLKGNLKVQGEARFSQIPEVGRLDLSGFQASLSSKDFTRSVHVNLGGRLAIKGHKEGNIRARGVLRHLFDPQGRLQLDRLAADMQAQANSLPLAPIEQLTGQAGLLVKALGPSVSIAVSSVSSGAEHSLVTLKLTCQKLKADDLVFEVGRSCQLSQPATLRWTLQPDMAARFLPKDRTLALQDPVPLELLIQKLSLPRPAAGASAFEPLRTILKARLKLDRINLTGVPSLHQLHIEKLLLNLGGPSLAKARLEGSCRLEDPSNKGLLAELSGRSALNLTFRAKGGLTQSGTVGSASIEGHLKSARLRGQVALRLIEGGQRLGLQTPATWHIQATPELLQKLQLTGPGWPTLQGSARVVLDIQKLTLPMGSLDLARTEGLLKASIPELRLVSEASRDKLRLKNLVSQFHFDGSSGAARLQMSSATFLDRQKAPGALDIDLRLAHLLTPKGKFDLSGSSLVAQKVHLKRMPVALLDAYVGPGKLLSSTLGKRLDLEASASLPRLQSRHGVVNLSLRSPLASLDLGLKLGGRITLSKPAALKLTLTPGGLAALQTAATASSRSAAERMPYRLLHAVTLKGTLTSLRWPLPKPLQASGRVQSSDPGQPSLAGSFSASRLALEVTARHQRLLLDKLHGHLQGADVAQALDLEVGATLLASAKQGGAGTLAMVAHLTHLLDKEGAWKPGQLGGQFSLSGRHLQLQVLERFLGETNTFSLFAGPDLNLDLEGRLDSLDQRRGELALKARSPLLALDMGIKVARTLTLKRPATWKLTLTPEGFDRLVLAKKPVPRGQPRAPAYRLSEPALIKGTITRLRWPLLAEGLGPKTSLGARLKGAAVSMSFSSTLLALRGSGHKQYVTLSHVNGHLASQDLSQALDLSFQGEPGPAPQGGEPGSLALNMTLKNLFDRNGALGQEQMSADLSAHMRHLPVALLDILGSPQGLISAALGAYTNASFSAKVVKMRGPVSFQADSQNASARLSGHLTARGFVLDQPLVASLSVTSEMGRKLLYKIHPLFRTVRSSKEPLHFSIPPQGVLFPVRQFDIRRVVVPIIRLEEVSMDLKSGNILDGALGIAGRIGGYRRQSRGGMTMETTPLVASLKQGILRYDRRLDLLLDGQMHLATWGTVDLGRKWVDLTLAFMPSTIQHIFHLRGLGQNDSLQIPITGPLGSPKTDYSSIATEVARLKAQRALAKRGGGLLGGLLGHVMNKVLHPKHQSRMPPASANPLPWLRKKSK